MGVKIPVRVVARLVRRGVGQERIDYHGWRLDTCERSWIRGTLTSLWIDRAVAHPNLSLHTQVRDFLATRYENPAGTWDVEIVDFKFVDRRKAA